MGSGEIIIILFGQGLWFGNRMEKKPTNPDQCRAFEIPIYDDLTDQHRPQGIEAYFKSHIPMLMMVSTCGFIT